MSEQRAADDPGRNETEEQREDRNLAELLQELRIAGLGVQVLFGFLLSLPFSTRFPHLNAGGRHLYVASLSLATIATALLTAPVAYHRFVFRRHRKGALLRIANAFALVGLGAVGLAISSAVLLVTELVLPFAVAVLIGALSLSTFTTLWFLFPLTRRGARRADGRDDRENVQ